MSDDLRDVLAATRIAAMETLREFMNHDDPRIRDKARRLLKRHAPRPPSPIIERVAHDAEMRRLKYKG